MRNKIGNSFWGIFLIIIGLAFAGDAFGYWDISMFFRGWWTLFIIVPCVISIIESGFNFLNSVGLIIGVIFLLSAQGAISSDTAGKLVLPIVFIGIGIGIIFRRHDWNRMIKVKQFNKDSVPEYTAVFAGQECQFSGERFYGANLTAIFGGIDLYLKDSIIEQDVQINATTIFGGANIIVPSNVKVKIACTPIFGGVSNKAISSSDDNAPTIYINSSCVFGGVEVK